MSDFDISFNFNIKPNLVPLMFLYSLIVIIGLYHSPAVKTSKNLATYLNSTLYQIPTIITIIIM